MGQESVFAWLQVIENMVELVGIRTDDLIVANDGFNHCYVPEYIRVNVSNVGNIPRLLDRFWTGQEVGQPGDGLTLRFGVNLSVHVHSG